MDQSQILVRNMEKNKQIRKASIEFRNSLGHALHKQYDEKICKRILESTEYQNANLIFMYMAYRNEVDLSMVLYHAWEHKKRIGIPKVSGEDLIFYEIQSMDELVDGYHSIKEPSENLLVVNEMPQLILVPGVAFDRRGNRLGYGKGFYDRFFHQHMNCYKLAVAYEGQFSEQISVNEHDVRMDCIITEKERINCSEGK